MNKALVLIVLFVSSISYSQIEKFEFTSEGFTDYLVVPCIGKTKEILYQKTLDWIAKTYNNPKEVIKAKIDNEYIRIEGASENLICISSIITNCYDSKYQIEVSFKDDKYKFDVTKIEYFIIPDSYSLGGWFPLSIDDTSGFYNKKGKLKKAFKEVPESVSSYFSDLNFDLNLYIESKEVIKKKNDW